MVLGLNRLAAAVGVGGPKKVKRVPAKVDFDNPAELLAFHHGRKMEFRDLSTMGDSQDDSGFSSSMTGI